MAVHQAETFTFAATGDSMITREILPYEGNADAFDDLLALLRGTDATMTNLEVLLHDYEGYPSAASGGTYMRSPPNVADELIGMGCNLFSAATNHTIDYSHGSIERTIAALRERNAAFAGLGENLYEARKPASLETPAGRVAMVSACSTITPGSEAGEQSPALRGRPGLNPLHIEQVYTLPESRLDELRKLSHELDIEDVKDAWRDRGMHVGHDWDDEEYFHFWDMKFEAGDEGGIEYAVDGDDREAIVESIEEARRNADWVVATLHAHHGPGGHARTRETPDFVREFGRTCVDAGADAFVVTGPHVFRGIEMYDGSPLFYSLGHLIVQNETVERLPPESFQRYGYDNYTRASQVFDSRLYNDDGEPKGDLANAAFWQSVVPVCEFSVESGLERIEFHPITLQQKQPRPQRGIPVLAEGEEAATILDQLVELSAAFDTSIDVDEGVGVISL
ncbi:CapA family protein (plasmid) [Natrinema zhouii]|uniref:CapA family protein n=1 Tax=Natrinema zhouii TaxID=1710539 RepID=UPI001CFFB2E6|nr:CapA family protein [Natrinema zhouii]UHQ98575.1 CapA family protein [Natrinema zhouii]